MSVEILWQDTETYSEVDIKNGTDNYSRAAELCLWAYAPDDGPVRVIDYTPNSPIRVYYCDEAGLIAGYETLPHGVRIPADLAGYLADHRVKSAAHNATFDRNVLSQNGYSIPIPRWHCTMAQALAHSLPGALDKLCDIFQIGEDKAKLKDGKALVLLFCKPQKFKHTLKRDDFVTAKEYRAAIAAARDAWQGRATRHTHPAEWARYVQYCANDVVAMRAVYKKMPKWNFIGNELALWHADQRVNSSGVCIDMELVHAAIETAKREKEYLAGRAQELTDYDAETGTGIKATTQRTALLELLNEQYDCGLEDLRGSTIEKLLKTDHNMPAVVVELLENRLAASSTSVAKYEAFAKLTGPDGYLRNTIQFCGAMRTGRDAGRGVQLQNLARPTMKQKQIAQGILDIKADCADLIWPNVMALLSSSVRGAIVAGEGKKLVVADLSNIEGRMLAWLAGEEWKLQAFRDFDTCLGNDGQWYTGDQIRDAVLAGKPLDLKLDAKGEPTRKGHDLYALAYAKAFGVTPEAVMENKKSGDGSWRQIGKVMELALGYEGGVGAFVTFALAYGIDLDDMAEKAIGMIPPAILEKAEYAYKWAVEQGRDYGMAKQTFLVCDSFKRLWRNAHPATCKLWKDLENAFRNAILTPGATFTVRHIKIVKSGAWLRMILPSGRSLCYPSPRLTGEGEKISYMGVSQFSRQWVRINTYSGKIAENATQGASRCLLKSSTFAIVDAGYDQKIPVHDENITEAEDDPAYNADHLAALMANNPVWAKGLPLAAAGFSDYRYRKD